MTNKRIYIFLYIIFCLTFICTFPLFAQNVGEFSSGVGMPDRPGWYRIRDAIDGFTPYVIGIFLSISLIMYLGKIKKGRLDAYSVLTFGAGFAGLRVLISIFFRVINFLSTPPL